MAGSRIPTSKLGNALSFKRFMLRSEVLKLYREMLRIAKKVPTEQQRKELTDWIRHDFKSNKHVTDEEAIKMMITRGRMSLKELQSTVDLSR